MTRPFCVSGAVAAIMAVGDATSGLLPAASSAAGPVLEHLDERPGLHGSDGADHDVGDLVRSVTESPPVRVLPGVVSEAVGRDAVDQAELHQERCAGREGDERGKVIGHRLPPRPETSVRREIVARVGMRRSNPLRVVCCTGRGMSSQDSGPKDGRLVVVTGRPSASCLYTTSSISYP